MKRFASTGLVLALGLWPLAGALGAGPAQADGKATQREALAKAAAEYSQARTHCRTLSGQHRRVCFAEARAAYRKAEAKAVAELRDTPRARMDAEINAANAELAAARARCATRPGSERETCRREAKEAQRAAVAEAVRKERAAAPASAPATRLVTPPPTAPAQATAR
jgi:hypothetical protein